MKISIILALILSSFCVKAQEMQKYLNDTRDLVKKGEFKEALKRDIWFHDHALEHERAMSGVRLSFALSDWKALGQQYPPALKAMQKIRDQKTKAVIDNGSADLFDDVTALNRTLGEDGKTVELFKIAAKKHPDAAKQYYRYVKDQLFAAKEYSVISNYIGSPLDEFNEAANHYKIMNTLPGRSSRPGSALLHAYTDSLTKKYNDKKLVDRSVQLIQYAVAVNNVKAAKEIQQKAELIVKDDRLKNALPN